MSGLRTSKSSQNSMTFTNNRGLHSRLILGASTLPLAAAAFAAFAVGTEVCVYHSINKKKKK